MAKNKKNKNLPTVSVKFKGSVFAGNRVYVPTPEHGFAEAEVVKVDKTKGNRPQSLTVRFVDQFIQETYGEGDIVYMQSNIQKLVPKGNEHVRPLFWTAQNRKSFPDWIAETFKVYRCRKNSVGKKGKNKKTFEFFPYQEFVRDYMGHNSPYRGILLYHGLGTGKTCAAVAIAENLRDTRNVVVMLPAALRANFIHEGLKQCGDPLYQETGIGNKLINDKYTFVSYNASNVVDQLEQVGTLDNKIVVVDEVHNLATMIVNGLRGLGKQGAEVYRRLLNAKNSKFTFLSGTPLVNTPFEIAMLLNILRGPLEVLLFNVRRFSEETIDGYLAELIKDDRIGFAELNRRNRSLVVLARVQSWDVEFESTLKFVESKAREHQVYLNFVRVDKYPLFPEDDDEFDSYFVKNGEFINKNMYQRRILGLVSFYKGRGTSSHDFPTQLPTETVKVDMSPHQFELYEMAREKEREKERQAAYQRRMKKGDESKVPTLARVFSREFSNFVFPDDIVRPFKAFQFISTAVQEEKEEELKRKVAKGEITAAQAKKELTQDQENRKKVSQNKIDAQILDALNKLSNPTKPYLKLGPKGLERYSPKMEAMLKEILKTKEGLILVYSAFRRVEGLEIFARILERNGFARYDPKKKMDPKYDYKRFTFYSGVEDAKERANITKLFISPENKTGKLIRVLLASPAGTEGLDLKNIRKVLIMEPYWHEIRIQQVIGRAVRWKSHMGLPEKDRNVKVIRYMSILSPQQRKDSREKISTDEYVYEVALRKEALNDEFRKATQEAAVDCLLNKCFNQIPGKCFNFTGKKEGLAFLPDISRDLVYGFGQTQTREVKREVRVAALTEHDELIYKKKPGGQWFLASGKTYKKKPKLSKSKKNKFVLDPESMDVFDYDQLRNTGQLDKVGRATESGKLELLENMPNEIKG